MQLSAATQWLRAEPARGARHNALFCDPQGGAAELRQGASRCERTAQLCRTRRYVHLLQASYPGPAPVPASLDGRWRR